VLNATNQAFLALQIKFEYTVQQLEVISLDGVPLQTPTNYTTISLPPAVVPSSSCQRFRRDK
jgi:hypothetical protein